jgi:hypothetical protein
MKVLLLINDVNHIFVTEAKIIHEYNWCDESDRQCPLIIYLYPEQLNYLACFSMVMAWALNLLSLHSKMLKGCAL